MNCILRRTFLLSVIILIFSSLHAQEDTQDTPPPSGGGEGGGGTTNTGVGYNDFLPPSPTSYELGKYGQIPVNLSSGTPSVSIPLHTFSTQNLNVPLSLSYNSDGIKVDQLATWVGLAWSLNAGGVITRTIRGTEDNPYSWPYPQDIKSGNLEAVKYIDSAAQSDDFDTEPDLFTFNFMGHSGKFVFNDKGHALIMPYQNLQIERLLDYDVLTDQFIVTTPDGIKYYFGGTSGIEKSKNDVSGTGCPKVFSQHVITSWYLTKVEHPAGDVINFEYQNVHYNYEAGISQTITKNRNSGSCTTCPTNDDQNCTTVMDVEGVRLSKISSDDYGEIIFDAIDVSGTNGYVERSELKNIQVKTADDVPLTTYELTYSKKNGRSFLTNLTELSANANEGKVYEFQYESMSSVPARLSRGQDHWGYYNGADSENQTYIVPENNTARDYNGILLFDGIGGDREPNSNHAIKGMLNKIIYPTGGSTEFEYEPHSYFGTKTYYPSSSVPFVSSCTGSNFSDLNECHSSTFKIYSDYLDVSFSVLDNNQSTGHQYVELNIVNVTKGITEYSQSLQPGQQNNPNPATFHITPGDSYRVELNAYGAAATGTVNFSYWSTAPYDVEENIEAGGVRISKIIDYDPLSDKSNTKRYFYGPFSNLNESSGVAGFNPTYHSYYSEYKQTTSSCINDPCLPDYCNYGVLHSNSQYSLFNINGRHITYQYVTISHGENFENGGEEHKFYVNADRPGEIVLGNDIFQAPYSNIGWNNGLEEWVKIFKVNSTGLPVILTETINNYVKDSRNEDNIAGLVIRKKYNPVCEQPISVICDGTDYAIYENKCMTEHKHWLALGTWDGWRCLKSDADMQLKAITSNPCANIAVEDPPIEIPLAYELNYLDVWEYKNHSYWSYLESTTTLRYDENGENPISTTVEYNYDNPVHAQLSHVKTTQANGDITESFTKYPDDYDNASWNLPALKANHIVGVPIKSETTFNSNQVAGKVMKYNGFGQPIDMYSYESDELKPPVVHNPGSIPLSADYRLRSSLTYNNKGRIKEVVNSQSPNTVYLWGYNATKLVAYVTNAGLDRVYYNGFEELGVSSTHSRTGVTSHNGASFTIPSSEFSPVDVSNLVMTYWFWDGTEWQFSGEMAYTSNTVNSPGTLIDDIRIYPVDAQMTTYSYTPGVGMTSQTDANGKTTTYEYDEFNRLQRIRDHKGNIIKHMRYRYANQKD